MGLPRPASGLTDDPRQARGRTFCWAVAHRRHSKTAVRPIPCGGIETLLAPRNGLRRGLSLPCAKGKSRGSVCTIDGAARPCSHQVTRPRQHPRVFLRAATWRADDRKLDMTAFKIRRGFHRLAAKRAAGASAWATDKAAIESAGRSNRRSSRTSQRPSRKTTDVSGGHGRPSEPRRGQIFESRGRSIFAPIAASEDQPASRIAAAEGENRHLRRKTEG